MKCQVRKVKKTVVGSSIRKGLEWEVKVCREYYILLFLNDGTYCQATLGSSTYRGSHGNWLVYHLYK